MGPIRVRKKRRSRPNRTQAKTNRRGLKSKMGEITLQIVIQSYRFASFVKSVPLEVTKGSNLRLVMFEKKWKACLWYLSNGALYAYVIFQAYSFPNVMMSQGLTRESSIHIEFVLFYCLGILYFGTMLRDGSTYVGLSNGMDSLLKWTQDEDWTTDKWNKSPFALVTVGYFAQVLAIGFPVTVFMFLLYPTDSRYPSSLLPAFLQDQIPVRLMGVVLEGLIFSWIASNLQASYCYWCMTVLQKTIWLDDLCRAAENCGVDVNMWHKLLSFYRSLKCLNIVHNEFCRHFTGGFIVIIAAVVVLFLYCSLRAFTLVPIWVYIAFPTFTIFCIVLILVLLPLIAKWEQKSADFISISMTKLRPLRLRDAEFEALFREVRAMRKLENEIGHFGAISLETSKEMILQIIDYLLLLLSL